MVRQIEPARDKREATEQIEKEGPSKKQIERMESIHDKAKNIKFKNRKEFIEKLKAELGADTDIEIKKDTVNSDIDFRLQEISKRPSEKEKETGFFGGLFEDADKLSLEEEDRLSQLKIANPDNYTEDDFEFVQGLNERGLLGKKNNDFDPDAALTGFGEANTFGYLAKAQAGLEGLLPDPSAAADEQVREQLGQGAQVESSTAPFDEREASFQRAIDRKAAESPGSFLTGAVVGSITPGIGGTKLAGKGLQGLRKIVGATSPATKVGKALHKVAQGAGAGGVLGFLQNPHKSGEGDDPEQRVSRIDRALVDATIGGGIQSLIELTPFGWLKLRQVTRFVKKEFVDKELIKKITNGSVKAFTKFTGNAGSVRLKETVKFLRQAGITGKTSAQEAAAKIGALKKTVGKKIGEFYENALQSLNENQIIQMGGANFNGKIIADTLDDVFSKTVGAVEAVDGPRTIFKKIQSLTQLIREGGKDIPIERFQEIKSIINRAAQEAVDPNGKPTEAAKQLLGLAKAVNDTMLDKLQTIGRFSGEGRKFVKKIKILNKQYGRVIDLVGPVQTAATNEAATNIIKEGIKNFAKQGIAIATISGVGGGYASEGNAFTRIVKGLGIGVAALVAVKSGGAAARATGMKKLLRALTQDGNARLAAKVFKQFPEGSSIPAVQVFNNLYTADPNFRKLVDDSVGVAKDPLGALLK